MYYNLNDENFVLNFGKITNGLNETIELNLKLNEEIFMLNIRSGAMIDAINLFTNINNSFFFINTNNINFIIFNYFFIRR